MDAVIDRELLKIDELRLPHADAAERPTRAQAEHAVRTLIEWAGDDPLREGLKETPARVIRAYEEFFRGYEEDPETILARTFQECENYDDMVMLRDVTFESHCEHHIAPILGRAHIAYMPDGRIVGISKLARVVEVFARRLQTQEALTAQIGNAIQNALRPKGVALLIEAEHQCMTMRGVRKPRVDTITTHFKGLFEKDDNLRNRFLNLTAAARR